jgi:hypothetical protein
MLLQWTQDNNGKPEADWPLNGQCRSDLGALQERLSGYAIGLATLAGVPDIQALVLKASS